MKPEIKTCLAQIRAGEIPQGYKKTKLGIIPQEWEVMSLKSRFDRLTRKNSEGNTNVMTISAQYGLINQGEFFKKEIASEDKSNYYLLHNGEFAYNKSYSSGYSFGAIKRLSLYDKGIVSPLYICFSANNHNPCPEFYQHYFEGGKLNSEIQAIAQEGARNHGLLNISVEDFFYTKIIVPPLEEQKKIADILSAQDRIIELCERKIEQLKRMKKYYLQNMFPKGGEDYPEIRFKGFTDAWEQRKLIDVCDYVDYRGKTPIKTEDGIFLVTAKNVKDGYIDYETSKEYISEDDYEEVMHRGMPEIGDILITTEAPCGNVAQVNRPNIALAQRIIKYRGHKNTVDNTYLKHYLLAPEFQSILTAKSSGGTVQGIKGSILHQQEIKFPKYEEQIKIGSFLNNLDTLITLHQRKCEEEKKKKKALQQLLLTGIVRVKI